MNDELKILKDRRKKKNQCDFTKKKEIFINLNEFVSVFGNQISMVFLCLETRSVIYFPFFNITIKVVDDDDELLKAYNNNS